MARAQSDSARHGTDGRQRTYSAYIRSPSLRPLSLSRTFTAVKSHRSFTQLRTTHRRSAELHGTTYSVQLFHEARKHTHTQREKEQDVSTVRVSVQLSIGHSLPLLGTPLSQLATKVAFPPPRYLVHPSKLSPLVSNLESPKPLSALAIDGSEALGWRADLRTHATPCSRIKHPPLKKQPHAWGEPLRDSAECVDRISPTTTPADSRRYR